jgi:hypothetical protein
MDLFELKDAPGNTSAEGSQEGTGNFPCWACDGVITATLKAGYDWCQGTCDVTLFITLSCSHCMYSETIFGDGRDYGIPNRELWDLVVKRMAWYKQEAFDRISTITSETPCHVCDEPMGPNTRQCEVCGSDSVDQYDDWIPELIRSCPHRTMDWGCHQRLYFEGD